MNILLDNQYCPAISYFALMLKAEQVWIEQHENFVKSSARNRAMIAGPNGLQMLSIPIESGKSHRQLFSDVRASQAEPWHKIHWQSLCSSYRRSPYFEYYEYDLADFYETNDICIFDWNKAITQKIIELLKLEIKLHYTSTYQSTYTDLVDARNLFKEKKYAPAIPSYIQVFGDRHPFLNDLSILDLLFNQGPNAKTYLQNLANQLTWPTA